MSVLLEALLALTVSIGAAGRTHQLRLDRADEADAEQWIETLRVIRAEFQEAT